MALYANMNLNLYVRSRFMFAWQKNANISAEDETMNDCPGLESKVKLLGLEKVIDLIDF